MTSRRRPDDDDEWLRAAVERTLGPLRESGIFLAIFSTDYVKDARAVLELGLAILLDKPIALVIRPGQVIPTNIRRLAVAVEELDPDRPDAPAARAAIERITAAAAIWELEHGRTPP